MKKRIKMALQNKKLTLYVFYAKVFVNYLKESALQIAVKSLNL